MTLPILTIQYLEDYSNLAELKIAHLVERLKMAVDLFPFSHLLIGWQLPLPVLEACRLEAERLGLRFLRWQPLLTTDKGFPADPSWQVVGLTGYKVPGYQGKPEFTFFCPNHPAAQEAILEHLKSLIQDGLYQGFFLDRVRFPSPSLDPTRDLACFCEYCNRKAAEEDLDLEEIRRGVLQEIKTGEGCLSYIKTLLSGNTEIRSSRQNNTLSQFLTFRQKSISDFLTRIVRTIKQAHLEIGIDCFSPSLTRMVGQDLNVLGQTVDWIKLMTYAHTLAPAGLPYELLGLARYLTKVCRLGEKDAFDKLTQFTGLPLPSSCKALERQGLSSTALQIEVRRGTEVVSEQVVAGIELVDLPGVTHLDPDQIRSDVEAIKCTNPAGLAVSWDLLHIPLDRLKLVAEAYFAKP